MKPVQQLHILYICHACEANLNLFVEIVAHFFGRVNKNAYICIRLTHPNPTVTKRKEGIEEGRKPIFHFIIHFAMKVHEYQAKAFFADYGVPVDKCILCHTAEEAVTAYRTLGVKTVVVKAQVHTGGRGKAGGVKLAHNEEEVADCVRQIIGMTIRGFVVDRVLVTEAADIASEYYCSILIDRKTKSPLLMLSREGGMEIEQVARETPEKIVKVPIDPLVGLPDFQALGAGYALFDDTKLARKAGAIFQKLYRLFMEKDASLVEINPLVLTKQGNLEAVDAKMTFDNNALFRHPDVQALNEPTPEEKVEQEAKAKGFSYVNLGGNIGCMVNGAGLAMATMDMIKLYGGDPANFLDIGGSSNPTKIVEAMKLLMADKHVNVVLINIFGGITRCDDVAKGLIEAFKIIKTDMPIVIRLTGTNEKEGRELLKGSTFHVAHTMGEAGKMAVELSKNL